MPGVDANTKLMLHFNRPDNTLPKAVTVAGSAKLVTATKKYGNSSLYIAGNSDFVSVPDSADWVFGTGDFTLEGFINYAVSAPDYGTMIGQGPNDDNYWGILTNGWTPNTLHLNFQSGIGVTQLWIRCAFTPSAGVWHHVAITRASGVCYMFIDGDSKTVTNIAGAQNADLADFSGVLRIGTGNAYINYGTGITGNIDGIRISKGLARYTSSFTVPAYAPLSDINTQLLLNFDGADAAVATYDSAGGDENGTADKAPTYAVTAQIDTADKKFGGSSLLLDGDSDYITLLDSADWSITSASMTVDFFVKLASNQDNNDTFFCHYEDSSNLYRLYVNNADKLRFDIVDDGADAFTMGSASVTLPTGEWVHIALVKNGDAWVIYQNGASVASGTHTGTYDFAGTFRIGTYNTTTCPINGWIDEFRVSNIARWTAPFTPPTAEYSTDPGTTIKKISGVTYANIKKVSGVAIASVKKAAGVA